MGKSTTLYPTIFLSLELWICFFAHGAVVALVHLEYIEFPDAQVPLELVGALIAVAILSSYMLFWESQCQFQEVIQACSHVGEETRRFVQELQSNFGRVEEGLTLRFAAAEYALAALYIFFFTITAGSITPRCWSEIRAKGLLDDREVRFLQDEYAGDRMALLHIWSMWAVQEAASLPGTCAGMSPEIAIQSIARMSAVLQRVAAAASIVTDHVAMPSPFQLHQLHESLILICMIVVGVAAAPASATTHHVATVAFVVILVAVLGIRQAAASLSNPLGNDNLSCFPIASMLNATSDTIVHLLIGSTPSVFNPSSTWWDATQAVLSQGQIERRIPATSFPTGGANLCHWQSFKAECRASSAAASSPLADIGCCHVDAEDLPRAGTRQRGMTCQEARKPQKDNIEALLSRLQLAMDLKGKPSKHTGHGGSQTSTADLSEIESDSFRLDQRSALSKENSGVSYSNSPCPDNNSEASDDWGRIAQEISTLPRERSLESSTACISKALAVTEFACDEFVVTGQWAGRAEQSRKQGVSSVSPNDLVQSTSPSGAVCTACLDATSTSQLPHACSIR